jgi:hypothetical protein
MINFVFITSDSNVSNKNATWYNFKDYDMSNKFYAMPIPQGSQYSANGTCVTFGDLVQFNYTDKMNDWKNYLNVFPENFCYSMLTYNISREDFFNIIDKNLGNFQLILFVVAFYNYRKLIAMWTIYNYTDAKNMDEDCSGYLRNIACWTQFPACIDNNDNSTWVKFFYI